jgi:hypothetical protein
MFKIMQTVLTTKRAQPEEIQKIPPFIFRRWLSNDPRTIQAINFFNTHSDVPIDVQYDAIQAFVGGRINYISFPKKIKDESLILEKIQKFYNTSKETAKLYLELLTPQDIQNIENELQELIPNAQPKKSKGKK